MQIVLNIDDNLLNKAAKLTGISEQSLLVCEGLKSLIFLESCERLAKLGGTEPYLEVAPRRRYSESDSC
jgi:Arc/MetJ family transcription regulator